MKVACIILNYNDSNSTIGLVEKVKNYRFDKIIIVDNCSTDDSLSVLKRLYIQNSKIEIIKSDKNGGYGPGNNLGLDYAKHNNFDYAVVANPDVDFSEECLIKLCQLMENDLNIAVGSATQLDINGQVVNTFAWNLMPIRRYILSFSRLFWKYNLQCALNYNSEKNKGICSADCVPGAMLILRLSAFDEVYDRDIFLYCEETVLGMKAKEKGYTTKVLTNTYYQHNHSVTINKTYGTKSKKRKLMRDSALIVLEKYYHASKFQIAFARLFFFYCLIETKLIDLMDCILKRN